jgi:hypothetical protein
MDTKPTNVITAAFQLADRMRRKIIAQYRFESGNSPINQGSTSIC